MYWVSANRGKIYQTSGSSEGGNLEVNSTIKEESLQMSTLMFKHNISASLPLPGVCVRDWSFSHVQLFATLWTVAHQAAVSMGISRQENWSVLPFPSPLPGV